eukprot:UN08210
MRTIPSCGRYHFIDVAHD